MSILMAVMNYIFISPNFPKVYRHFVKELHLHGVNVLGIGDEPYEQLDPELKDSLTEYCFVADMNRVDWMINTINYLKDKYGRIDFIESNNEYWLHNDATYREWFNVPNGFNVSELEDRQRKSGMKKYFKKAGAKVARYILVSSLKNSEKFVKKVGFPVFAKPDLGVGAAKTFKIRNQKELKAFHEQNLEETYIMEEYLDGSIISFDGIADANSKVVMAFNEFFPTPIADVVSRKQDVYYYAKSVMPDSFYKLGEKIVKSFGLKQRCFHIEFFVLKKDKEGLGKKGDIVALEANLRTPGGNTADLLNLTTNISYYKTYADVIVGNKVETFYDSNRIAVSVDRRNEHHYEHSDEEIKDLYSRQLIERGTYPKVFAEAMGDVYYFAVFSNEKDMKKFVQFVMKKQ